MPHIRKALAFRTVDKEFPPLVSEEDMKDFEARDAARQAALRTLQQPTPTER